MKSISVAPQSVASTAFTDPIRVVYDTAVIGFGQYEQSGRTGVYRMVEGLAEALVEADGCQLYFSAAECFQMLDSADTYFKGHGPFGRIPLLKNSVALALFHLINGPYRRLTKHQTLPFPLRVLRRTLGEACDRIDRNYPALPHQALSGKQIYHSPYWGLPSSTLHVPGLSRFLTVHDVLSIVHPEPSSDSGAFLKSILSTAGKEDWIVCVSEATRQDLLSLKLNINPEKVRVVYEAASELFFPNQNVEARQRVREKYQLGARPYFLSVCTLESRKNLEHLVRCFARVIEQQKWPDVDLVLVGSKSNSLPRLLALFEELKLDKTRVHLTGYVGDNELAPLYSGAMGFFYPSLWEGFGLPPLEAMQCGIPVVVSNTSSLPEVVGDAGILVGPHDGDALCQSMVDLYNKPTLRESLSALSLKQAAKFSWRKAAAEHLDLYRLAASSKI